MNVPPKAMWKATASSDVPRHAIDDRYATMWVSDPSEKPWLEIDLGVVATLGGLEIYWGHRSAGQYEFTASKDGDAWSRLCGTRHGEGGQEVFGFPPIEARFVRWSCENLERRPGPEIVEINIYAPADAVTTLEEDRIAALGHAPVVLATGESITVDLGYVRPVVGTLVEWGDAYGTDFSTYLSRNGEEFHEVGRIATGEGQSDSFWWLCATSRYVRLTVHKASAPDGAVVNELKLRILDRDRMPIGQLERAARDGRGDLYPQALLGRQVYWTVLGEFDQAEEALFDEYGDLEPRRGAAQITPLLRVGANLHGAPASKTIRCFLEGGSLPLPTVVWRVQDIEVWAAAVAAAGQTLVEYRMVNRGRARRDGALVLAVRPVQINPYWQHGGHTLIDAISVEGRKLLVNDQVHSAFSRDPDVVTVADFDNGDVARLIADGPKPTAPTLRSDSGLISAALEFAFSLPPNASDAIIVAAPLRDGVTPEPDVQFPEVRASVAENWRRKIGVRRITVGDREVTDTVEAQTALILVNATRSAFSPGPRNYDRVWIRDGSAQARALLWAGLIDDAKAFVLWYSKRIGRNGMVPPILNEDGRINTGYGSGVEFDAQGEFVGIATDVYRISKDRHFLAAIFDPVVRATLFIEELCARTNALHGPESRFHGLLPRSISHEGYGEPTYSYWDDYFALSAWRNCAYLAAEMGKRETASHATTKGQEFAANLARSLRMTAQLMGKGVIPGSADRLDVDPTSTSIAFEPCRVADVLPEEFLQATYDSSAARVASISATDFEGGFVPYAIRNINAFVSMGRVDDAFRLLALALKCRRPSAWRQWAEVVWSPPRAPQYIGDMPHTWVGAEFATAVRLMLVRESGDALELFRAVPDNWWEGEGIRLHELPTGFGVLNLCAQRTKSQVTVEMALAGPAPERVTFRYPGAKRAQADDAPCAIEGDVVVSGNFTRLVVDF